MTAHHPTGPGEDSVDVTVIQFAAHTAYLEPLTGTGFLVLPRPEHDVPAPEPSFVEASWSDHSRWYGGSAGLSLHRADWNHVLRQLDQEGWFLLDDEQGAVEVAGLTSDGRLAVCLYGDVAFLTQPAVADLERAITALRIAAGVPLD